MKKTIAFLMVLLPGVLFSQPESEFSGYLLHLPIYQPENDLIFIEQPEIFLNLTRLRLRPTLHLSDKARISLEYEITSLHQTAELFFSPTVDKTSRQTVDLRWRPVSEEHLQVEHFIDRLHFRQDFAFGNLVIGRQRVAWGTGRIWNPTDLFNPINPASFAKIEKDGADLLTGQLYLGAFTDFTLVYNPQENLRDNNAGFRFRSNYHTYDLAVIGGYFDERVVIGGDFAGNLRTAGVRGETIFSADRRDLDSNFLKFILGIDYQFTPKLYALAEYQYNGEGQDNPRAYELQRLIRGEIINLSRNYLYLQALYQLHPLLNSSVAYNANLNDHSGFAVLTLSYNWKTNLDISLGGQWFYGDSFDEYWYYPPAFFLQGQFYF